MARFYVKGTLLGSLETVTKKSTTAKGKKFEKTAVFVTVKNPVMCDKKGSPVDDEAVTNVCDKIADELESFAPGWAMRDFKDEEGKQIEYLNLASQYKPKLYIKDAEGKIVEANENDIIINNAEAIVFCNNTYHNQILILKNGEPQSSAFDDDFDC